MACCGGATLSPGAAGFTPVWSTDGGRTWLKQNLPAEFDHLLVQPLPSEAAGVMALAAGGDGATLFPFDKIYRSLDGGATWETIEESPEDTAYLGWGLVRPDGSLLVKLDAWSDDRAGKPGSHPRGLYQSSGQTWADLRFVQDLPGSAPAFVLSSRFEVADYAVTDDGGVRLWVYTYDDDVIYESGAGIDTWREFPAR